MLTGTRHIFDRLQQIFILFSQKCEFSHIFADFLLFRLAEADKIILATRKQATVSPAPITISKSDDRPHGIQDDICPHA